MVDFAIFLSAQQQTSDLARSALPSAPVHPTPISRRRSVMASRPRRRVSFFLRRLADLVEPAIPPLEPVTAAAC